MAKQLIIKYEDKTYTLEFTRKTVSQMEMQGFVADEVTKKPMTLLPKLFAGAFLANHRFVKPEVIEKIYARLGKKEELIAKLVEMYQEPLVTLLDEPDADGAGGNLDWTAAW